MRHELVSRLGRLFLAVLLLVYAVVSLVLLLVTVLSLVLVVVWVGLPLTLGCVLVQRRLADEHRRWAGRLLGLRIPSAYQPTTGAGFVERCRVVAGDPATWRDLVWLVANSSVGLALTIGALVETVLDLLFWWLPKSILLIVQAEISRVLLAPSREDRLAERVEVLTESRAETVDTQAAELRRIERDLHDGAQARLVALGMSLGMAEEQIDRDPVQARRMLVEAQATNAAALADLRDLVRGMLPPVLADRGLAGAVEALVLTTPLPVDVQIDLPGRLPAPVESAAYFAVAEALTNVIRHSGAGHARIRVGRSGGLLRMQVGDDGRGGADPLSGTGLRGIQRRLSAFDGTLALSSPSGGPTTLIMELPCASS